MRKKNMITKVCEQCEGEFEVHPYRKNKSRFCSRECKDKGHSKDMRGENGPAWKGGKIIKTCEQCGGEFKVKKSEKDRSRFCSKECFGEWQSENIRGENHPLWKPRVAMICEQCGGEYEAETRRSDASRFCSRECKGKWQAENIRGENSPTWKDKSIKVCEQCGEEFKVVPSKGGQQFCSRECTDKWRSKTLCGENSPLWKGGISFEPYCPKFNEAFKESIREKFGRVCFLCPTTEDENGRKLDVHHVSYDKDCLCDDSDCEFVPLCIRCHSKTNHDREYWEQAIMEKLSP